MGRWLFVIGLALAISVPGCKAKDKGPATGDVILEQPSEIDPGPGTRKVKRQAEDIAGAVKKEMASKTSWDKASVDKYGMAVQDSLVEWVQSKSGLDKDKQQELIAAFPQFVKHSLSPTVSSDSLPWHLDGVKYAVQMYAARITINKATRDKIDEQIDAFCDALEPALIQYFSERSSKETLTKVTADIRTTLKDCSRNPWFPALKEALDSKEENEVRDQIVGQTLVAQLNDFTAREAEGRKLNFDWGVTSAWSAATKFVSKSIKPPTDRMLMFTHSPSGPAMGFQVRPPMMQPSPKAGAPSGAGTTPATPSAP